MPCFVKLPFCQLFLLFLLLLPQLSMGQHMEDSLRERMVASDGIKKAELCMELANYFTDRAPDSSIYYGKIARHIGERMENKTIVIRSYAIEGDAYQKKSDLGKSISVYLTGLSLAEKTGEKSLEGTICNGIGVSYFYLNDLDKAEKYFTRAAKAKAKPVITSTIPSLPQTLLRFRSRDNRLIKPLLRFRMLRGSCRKRNSTGIFHLFTIRWVRHTRVPAPIRVFTIMKRVLRFLKS